MNHLQPLSNIFKQAYEITKQEKVLWRYGLLLIFGNLINFFYSINTWDDLSNFLLILFLVCLLLLVYFRAKAGMILALRTLSEKKEVSFRRSFSTGGLFVVRLLWLTISVQTLLFLSIIIIISPIAYLYSHDLIIRAVLLSILGSLVLFPLLFVIWMLNIFVPLFIFIFNLSFMDSVKNSLNFIGQFWTKLLKAGLILTLILLGGIITGAALASPFVILALISYYKGGLILSLLLFLFGSIVFLSTQAWLIVFQQASWFLLFNQLVKPQKLEEAKAVPQPEVI